jgi:hypothetical protein
VAATQFQAIAASLITDPRRLLTDQRQQSR